MMAIASPQRMLLPARGPRSVEESSAATAATSSSPRKQTRKHPLGAQRAGVQLPSPSRVIAPEGDALLEMEKTPPAQREKSVVIRFLPQGWFPLLQEGGRVTPVPGAVSSYFLCVPQMR